MSPPIIDVPSHLASSARLLRSGRVAEAEAALRAENGGDAWRAASDGLEALISRAAGRPRRAYEPLLDTCAERLNRQLASIALLVADRNAITLASARTLADHLIATTDLLGDDFNVGQALARNLRATALHYEGRFEEALGEIDAALALRDDEADHEIWITLPINGAAIAAESGREAAAARYVEMGLRVAERVDDPERVHALLRAAADLEHAQGRFLAARQKMETAVTLLEAARGPTGTDLSRARATLANIERELGDAGAAGRHARSALDAWPVDQGSPPYSILGSVAGAEWAETGDWRRYRGWLRPMSTAAGAEGPSSCIDFQANLALVCMDRNRFRAAERLYARLVVAVDEGRDPSPVRRVDLRRQHALCLIELGRLDLASTRLDEARSIVDEAGDGLGVYRHVIARERGRLLELQGRPTEAFDAFEAAVTEEVRNVGRRLGSTLSIGEAFGHRDAIDAVSPLLALASRIRTAEARARAHRAVLRSRGGATRAAARHREGFPPDLRPVLGQWSEVRRLVDWGARLREAGHPPADLAHLASTLVRLELELAGVGPDQSGADDAGVPELADDEAALDFVVTIGGEPRARDIRIFAFVSQGRGALDLLEWRDAATLLTRVDELRRAMGQSSGLDGTEPDLDRRIQELSDHLWGPIAACFRPTVRRLRVRPDANLGHLPLSALRQPDGRPLCEVLTIIHPRGEDAPAITPASNRFLVLGGPSPILRARDRFSLALATMKGRAPRVIPTTRLRNAAREAREVATMLRASGMSGHLLLGRHATRSALLGRLPAEVVHLACHGFSLGRSTSECPREGAVVGHPDHDWRVGLVLAGARGWLGRLGELGADDDGLLLARDVSLLDLRGVRLVVLAACETSVGEPVPGEGFIAMADAFLIAGALTVVAPSWAIDDRLTAEFMRDFYAALLRDTAVDEALRSVQAAWSASGRHPRLWAGYAVLGRPTLPREG